MDKKDGGPAFPVAEVRDRDGNGITEGAPGMSLRDWFAGQAMAGLLAHPVESPGTTWMIYAHDAYGIADAMLKARESKP